MDALIDILRTVDWPIAVTVSVALVSRNYRLAYTRRGRR